jgi:hypothetical protein
MLKPPAKKITENTKPMTSMDMRKQMTFEIFTGFHQADNRISDESAAKIQKKWRWYVWKLKVERVN